jgi:cytochrome P450
MDFVDPILRERRENPGDDLISTLATAEEDGRRLTDEEIYNFLRLLFPAGADTTYLGLGSTLYSLLTNPDQLGYVREDLGERCRWAGEEAIRLDPPTAWIPRINPRDVVWHGIEIPAGAPMFLGVMAANRDPAVFPDADQVRIDRIENRHAAFGLGIHRCLGSNLARMELRVALEEWMRRYPDFELADAAGVTWSAGQVRGPRTLPVRILG